MTTSNLNGGDVENQPRRHSSGEEALSVQRATKAEVFQEIVRRLQADGHEITERPGYVEELQAHFNRLPTRYALDMNVERAEDVVMHMRLLELVKNPDVRPVFHARVVEVPQRLEDVGELPATKAVSKLKKFAPHFMHEIAISTLDKPKLLSQLSAWLGDVGLNIQEAHVFSTKDGYSLDVFVVDGWSHEGHGRAAGSVRAELIRHRGFLRDAWAKPVSPPKSHPNGVQRPGHLRIPSDGNDWEIDRSQLKPLHKVASGSFGDLFRGTYCGQDVAIKVLKSERLNEDLQKEFAQEVFILRKVRHKNVVQFIGACTIPPNLCIVTEYMSGGSVYDYLHRHRSVLKLPMVLKIAIDVSKGMDYLHQSNIIHRDLKAANLLMDENDVVKIADFGVARVKAHTGVMTAETGTYRWMAPEVIEHRPYDHKADVFSFGVVLWELLTGKLPYDYLTPLQAAVAVVQKGLRPVIPKDTHPTLVLLMEKCWQSDPEARPEFSAITVVLQEVYKEVGGEDVGKRKEKKSGIFSAFRRNL